MVSVQNRSPIVLGFAGSTLIALGAFGAGATLLHDPVLAGTPLEAWRHGHGKSVATAVLYLGVILLLLAWVHLGRTARVGDVLCAIGAWSVPLLLAPPLFSTDLYTYLAQGAVAHAGLDPYSNVPAELPGPIVDNAAGAWMSIPSPYGPLFILLVKTVVGVTGDNLILGALLTRFFIVAGLGLLCFSLPRLCRHLGARTERALWIGVANPLVLLYLVAGAHNDLLMIGLMVTGAVFVLDRAPVCGFAVVALAVAVKVTAVVLLPFLVWIWVAQGRSLARALAASVSIVVTVFGACSLVAGVDLGWIAALGGNSELQPWLSVPTALGKVASVVVDVDPVSLIEGFRVAGWGALVVVVSWLWWRSRAAPLTGAAQALLATALLAPVTFPWYFAAALVLGAAVAWPARWVAVVGALSVWLTLSTHPDGKSLLPLWGFGLVFLATVSVGFLVPGSGHPYRLGRQSTGDSRHAYADG